MSCGKLVMGRTEQGFIVTYVSDKASKPVSQLPSSKYLKWTPDLTTQVNERRRKKPSTVSFEKQNKEGKSRSRSNRRKEGWSRYDTIRYYDGATPVPCTQLTNGECDARPGTGHCRCRNLSASKFQTFRFAITPPALM